MYVLYGRTHAWVYTHGGRLFWYICIMSQYFYNVVLPLPPLFMLSPSLYLMLGSTLDHPCVSLDDQFALSKLHYIRKKSKIPVRNQKISLWCQLRLNIYKLNAFLPQTPDEKSLWTENHTCPCRILDSLHTFQASHLALKSNSESCLAASNTLRNVCFHLSAGTE